MLISVNPTTGEALTEYPSLTEGGMNEVIEKAHQAFEPWCSIKFSERADLLNTVATRLRDNKSSLAEMMALEMGKPINEGFGEVEKAAWCAEYYAEHAEQHLRREVLESDAGLSYVDYPPLGTLLGILPWNAPLWLAFRYLAPALMAGNTCVMKHDPNVPGCAQMIEAIFNSEYSDGAIVANLPIANDLVEKAICHPHVAAVSFTGSSRTGSVVAATAAREIKRSVLELGGSDPLIILKDANLDKAADIACLSRIINAGQSCIAAKRVIVEAPVYDQVVEKLHSRLKALKMGNPLSESTDIGPLARPDLRDNLDRQVRKTIAEGARCLMGGQCPEGPGFFYPVTLLTDAQPGMCAMEEETFGPVMVVCKADNPDHALAIANDTPYGLGSAIWTQDKNLQNRFIEKLQAGQVAVNGIVKTDPRLPSGGIKKSGLGRELGPHGIKEFVNIKQVWIA